MIFPAAGYLEMALQAMMEHYGESAVELSNVLFLEPLCLQAGKPLTVQILLTALDTGRASFRIFSRPAQENNGSGWTLHTKGVAQQLQDAADSDGTLESARGACPDALDVGEVYRQFQSRDLDYGECFRGIGRCGQGTARHSGAWLHVSFEAGRAIIRFTRPSWTHACTCSDRPRAPALVGRGCLPAWSGSVGWAAT